MRLTRQFVAFRGFLADRQQTHSRSFDAEGDACVGGAHHAKLHQVRGLAFHRRARVEQHRRSPLGRHHCRERRAVHAVNHAEHRVRGDHCRASVAGTHQRRGVPILDPGRRHHHRRSRLAAKGQRRRLLHRHDVRGIHHQDIKRVGVGVANQLVTNHLGPADQVDADPEKSCRSQGAVDRTPGRMIAAHGVDRNAHGGSGSLLFVDRPHLAGAVIAAVGAHAVRGLRLAALRAAAGVGGGQSVVGAALAAPRLGVAAFWIRHCRSSGRKSAL
jgi:hypothetical protein